MAARLLQLRVRLGADADPVHRLRHRQSAIGFDRRLKTQSGNRRQQRVIQLQAGFAAGEHNIGVGASRLFRPQRGNGFGQCVGRVELAAILAVCAGKICVTKCALGGGAVALKP